MKSVAKLIDVICNVYDTFLLPEYSSSTGFTYCNLAAEEIAISLGCNDFHGRLANDMIYIMQTSPDWSEVPMEKAQELANQGSLVFATHHKEPHGHICVIRPGLMKTSGRWGQVPSVMNIGRENFINKSINWAFSEYPKLYVWRLSL